MRALFASAAVAFLLLAIALLRAPAQTAPPKPERALRPQRLTVSSAIQQLGSLDPSSGEKAFDYLMRRAESSSVVRRSVAARLIAVMHRDLGSASPAAMERLPRSAYLLGKLRAGQAVPLLAAHIDYSGIVFGLSLHRFPLAMALVDIGPPAVGAVAGVLSHSPVPWRRTLAAEVLGEICTPAAAASLRSALKTERDASVRHAISASLNEILNRPKSGTSRP